MTLIKEITAQETFIVPQPVLRKGNPTESCYFKGYNLEITHHFGLFENENLTRIISLFTTSNLIFAKKIRTRSEEWLLGKIPEKRL